MDFMKFDQDVLNEQVSVSIDGTLGDMVSILGIITLVQSDGSDVDGALDNIYTQVFEQIMSFGSLVSEEDDDSF